MNIGSLFAKLWVFLFVFVPSSALAAAPCPPGQFRSVFGDECIGRYEDWIGQVWDWALIIMIPLSVLILSAAGVLYMVSEGDSNRIGLAKKLIIGVFSGVGLLVLARLLLNIIGVEGFFNV